MTNTPSLSQYKNRLRLLAYVKPEAFSFLQVHGCHIEHCQGYEIVTFPAGSHQEPLSPTSQICSTITLPDGMVITAMNCFTKYIFLVIDLSYGHSMYLST